MSVCAEIGVTPILTASLAVFAYTQDPDMEVHDIDLSCSETDFPRLQRMMEEHDIDCAITNWHVLQTRRGDLKIEFDASEHWMKGIPDHYEIARIAGVQFHVVTEDGLRELYLRGFVDTAGRTDETNQIKHRDIRQKLIALRAPRLS